MPLIFNNTYQKPDIAILAKHGFVSTDQDGVYEAEFKSGFGAILYFVEGMISLYEEYKDERHARVIKLQMENDSELDKILYQTFYLPTHKPSGSIS
ncbi:hypothetical protein EWM62_02035 [Mucilaginibacter terrigena]|uniref:Uncharacterized protein n=1 Tax=Mucilaginibacter terrigena TaxID=2492395 RepID=A0A4Q5LS00_9SPHI|nr:hypothetical protein [Mucilaginibacter terrigena]RYU92237.1 hypothetical protein EWM62_02035 [Mucilaginibacter terrigena]